MYGFLQQSLVKLVLADDNGDILLEAIQAEMIKHLPQTQQNVSEGKALSDFFKHYDDAFSMRFLGAVAQALQLSEEECLRRSVFAIDTFIDSGFLSIMRSLGKDFYTFLGNLDSMHDNFLGSFPKMKPPSFKPIRNEDGTTTLHYRSSRQVLGPYTASLLKTTAKRLFDLDIDVEHVIRKGFNRADHDEFTLHMPDEAYPVVAEEAVTTSSTLSLAPETVDVLFPWHFAFDQDLVVQSVGPCLAKRLIDNPIGTHLRDLVFIQRPLECKYNFEDFKKRGGTPYQFALKEAVIKATAEDVCFEATMDTVCDGASQTSESSAGTCPFSRRTSTGSTGTNGTIDRRRAMAKVKKHVVQLHGEVVPVGDLLLFAGVPAIKSLTHMKAQGVAMSELPVHSHGREMMLGTMMQTLSAKQANSAAAKLRNLSDDRSAADRERALTGELLYKILPPVIADALTKGEKAPAETFAACTVLFSDVVGFTTISGSVPPEEVMNMLNELFAKFDELTAIHGVYKVETVGDAYVVSCGAPDPAVDHAERMCNFAIDMVRAASTVISPLDGEALQIRCGLHSGAVMSGVVGDVRPRYCLFGDTVNVASRMESTGLPASIQISYRVVRALPDASIFDIVTRGRIAVKGKGSMKTFLLLGLNGSSDPPLWPRMAADESKTVEVWQSTSPEIPSSQGADIALPHGRPSPIPRPLSRGRLSESNLKIHEKRLSNTSGNFTRMSSNAGHMRRLPSGAEFGSSSSRWPSPTTLLEESASRFEQA